MTSQPVRYTSADEDSGRWEGFPFRDGDIVISTRSKTGTTWVQMICALLIFQTPQLDGPIDWYSPWLDRLIRPKEEIFARLEGQQHRRFIKTHTPLDGLPIDPRATYIVTGRHPLDSAVSLYYQGQNISRARQRQLTLELTGQPVPAGPQSPRKPVREWLLDWSGGGCGEDFSPGRSPTRAATSTGPGAGMLGPVTPPPASSPRC